MCGHRLQGPKKFTSGTSSAILEPIEHSVINKTFSGLFFLTKSIIPEVDPLKSDSSTTSVGHSG